MYRWLILTGLSTTVLSLKWPSRVNPAELSNFETQARRLRYRALGVACRKKHIRNLLLAHHEDDQAESMLMRVAEMGKYSWSLQPMGDSGINIPECWGLHGVHESGLREFQAWIQGRIWNKIDPHFRQESITSKPASGVLDMELEEGGIKLYRPLMRFSKERLEATCRKHDVEWTEDKTNQDVTLTQRNAVRSVLRNHQMPKALAKESLLTLAERMVEKIKGYETRANVPLGRTKLLSLDLRSGRMLVRLPQRMLPHWWVAETHSNAKLSSARIKATLFCKKLLALVTPLELVEFSRAISVAQTIYPELLGSDAPTQNACPSSPKFTTGGVLIERLKAPLEVTEPKKKGGPPLQLDAEYAWSFTREPARRSKRPCSFIIPSTQRNPSTERSLRPLTSGKVHNLSSYLRWRLWDGRYWIRVSNSTGADLVVRLFAEKDLQAIRIRAPESQFESLEEQLRVSAPGDVRWTLPVIAESTGLEQPLALPTLHYEPDSVPSGLQWEIRYKCIALRGMEYPSCIS